MAKRIPNLFPQRVLSLCLTLLGRDFFLRFFTTTTVVEEFIIQRSEVRDQKSEIQQSIEKLITKLSKTRDQRSRNTEVRDWNNFKASKEKDQDF